MEVYLQLPFPPTINSYYLKGKIISSKGRVFREAVEQECLEQNANDMKLDDRISCATILYPPDRRVRDLDNYLKSLQDAITHAGVWLDDAQIDFGEQFRGQVVPGGACKVRIKLFEGMVLPFTNDIWDFIE